MTQYVSYYVALLVATTQCIYFYTVHLHSTCTSYIVMLAICHLVMLNIYIKVEHKSPWGYPVFGFLSRTYQSRNNNRLFTLPLVALLTYSRDLVIFHLFKGIYASHNTGSSCINRTPMHPSDCRIKST